MKLVRLFRHTRYRIKQRGYAMMVGLMATLTISIIGLNARSSHHSAYAWASLSPNASQS